MAVMHTKEHVETEIRQMIDEWQAAVRAKDADRLMKLYDPGVVVFDVPPPLQNVGIDAHRRSYENWWAEMPGRADTDIRDLRIVADEHCAFVSCLNHITSRDPTGRNDQESWLRVTVGLRRTNGRWKVVHEHISAPIGEDGRGLMNLKP